MLTHRIAGAALVASAALSGCSSSSSSPTDSAPLDPSSLLEVTSAWTDKFATASLDAAGVAQVATDYLDQVSPAHADQLAAELGSSFSIGGMREALAGADNQLGRYDEALAQLDKIAEDAPDTMPASSLGFLRSLNEAHVDARIGVVVDSHEKLDALADHLLANRPVQPDGWSDQYDYQLGFALYLDGRTDEALQYLQPLIAAADRQEAKLGIEQLGSALNLTVSALRSRGDQEAAQVYLEKTIAFDDQYHLNFSGRDGDVTIPPGALTSNPVAR